LKQNIGVLGAALGMDLDLVEAEVAVGPFSCDLVAKDVASNRWVVIENQLEPTDHGHLGQLMTYGAGTGAAVFVWIAPKFRDEHRAALDWLNEHSDEDSAFFGIEVEVVVIDDSARAAPNFKLVASPNEWSKDQRVANRPVTERGAAYEAFFERLLSSYKSRHPHDTNVTKSSKLSWLALAIGRSGFLTGWAFSGDRRFRIELYVDGGNQTVNKAHFDALQLHQGEIEQRLGHKLDWDRLDSRRACRISSYYERQPLTIMDGDAVLLPLIEWAVNETKKIRDIFRPYIQALPVVEQESGELRGLAVESGPAAGNPISEAQNSVGEA
jgi:hypothetical protein